MNLTQAIEIYVRMKETNRHNVRARFKHYYDEHNLDFDTSVKISVEQELSGLSLPQKVRFM